MSDAWADLNRRAAAVAGGVAWKRGMHDDAGHMVQCVCPQRGVREYSTQGEIGPFTGRPDMSHAGTCGILRAALGNPSVIFEKRYDDTVWQCGLIIEGRAVCDFIGYGDTREQAEAAALVELAEARTEWGPG